MNEARLAIRTMLDLERAHAQRMESLKSTLTATMREQAKNERAIAQLLVDQDLARVLRHGAELLDELTQVIA